MVASIPIALHHQENGPEYKVMTFVVNTALFTFFLLFTPFYGAAAAAGSNNLRVASSTDDDA